MGKDVDVTRFTREDRTRYRQKVRRCLDVFERMLRESRFDFARPMIGLEIELNLVDTDYQPHFANAETLEAGTEATLGWAAPRRRRPAQVATAAVGAIANAYARATGTKPRSFPIVFPVDFVPFPTGTGSTRVLRA